MTWSYDNVVGHGGRPETAKVPSRRLKSMPNPNSLPCAAIMALAFLTAPSSAQPKQKSASKPRNDVTIWVNKPAAGTLPKGVSHHTYLSNAMGHDVGYCIYLPPG